VGCCYAAGAFSFWSVIGLFLGNNLFLGNDNNRVVFSFGVRSEVVFSLGSVPRWYFLWGPNCVVGYNLFLSFEPPIQ
jgi:hypothetical protein